MGCPLRTGSGSAQLFPDKTRTFAYVQEAFSSGFTLNPRIPGFMLVTRIFALPLSLAVAVIAATELKFWQLLTRLVSFGS
jgi:hypothetical protein